MASPAPAIEILSVGNAVGLLIKHLPFVAVDRA
jgi:hypothetical protein